LLIGLTMIFFTTDPWMLFLFAPVYGISHGGFFLWLPPLRSLIFLEQNSMGVLFGTVMFFGALGGTLGPVIIGRLFDVYRSYDHAFALLIAFTLFGFVLTLGLKNPETGQFESEPSS